MKSVPSEEASWFQTMGTSRLFERGEALYERGDSAGAVYVVVRGLVKLSRRHDDARQVVLRVARRGALFGVPVRLDSGVVGRRDHSAYPLTDTIVREIEQDRFMEAIRDDPGLACLVVYQLSMQLRGAEDRLGDLMYAPVRARLTSTLLALADEVGRPRGAGDVLLDARLTHRDLASIIGATRETVSAAIVRMRNEGLIQQDGRQLVLKAPAQWPIA